MLIDVVTGISRVRAMRNLWPFIAVAAWVVAINELSSALVRHFFGLDHALWVLKPVLFVVHVENSQGTVALSGPIGKQIYGIVAFVSLGVATWALSRHEDAAFCRHRLGIGLLIGGILADGYQLLIVGSVTDFIGVRPFGLI